MSVDEDNVLVYKERASLRMNRHRHEQPRGFIAEWTVTIILLLFGTTTLVQAFVIPTGSMEDTLLVGDHLLVDKLAYRAAGRRHQSSAALRRREPRRHHRLPLSRSISGRPS